MLQLCRHYGFKEQSNPIIFTSDGKLIGGIADFYELAAQKFGITKKNISEKLEHHVI